MSYRTLASVGILLALGIVSAIVEAQDETTPNPRPATAGQSGGSSQPGQLRSVLVGPAGASISSSQKTQQRPRLVERINQIRESAQGDDPSQRSSTWSGATVRGPVLSDPATPGRGQDEPAAMMSINSNSPAPVLEPTPRITPITGAESREASQLPSTWSTPNSTMAPVEGHPSARRTTINPRARINARSNQGVLSASEGPRLSTETLGPDAIVIGKEAEYVVRLINDGAVAAEGVHVRVALPVSVKVIRADTQAGSALPQDDGLGQQHLRWTVDHVPAGGHQQLKLTLKPTDSKPFGLDVAWTFRPTSTTAQIQVQKPELELALFGPKDMLYGKTAVFTIQLTNPGTGDAEDVVLEFLYGEQQLEPRQVGTIAAGEQKEIDVELTAAQAGVLRVAVQAMAASDLHAEASQDVAVRRGQLAIEVVGSPVEFAGSTTSYRVRLTNSGDATVTDLSATLRMPRGAKVITISEQIVTSDSSMSWRIGSLSPGAERLLDVQCELMAPGENRLEVRAQADDDLQAMEAFVTEVKALADLKLLVNDPQGPTSVGDDAVFELRIVNRGTKAAEQVRVIAQFSDGIEPVEVRGSSANIVPGQVLFQSIPRVEASEELILKVVARADSDGMHRFRVQVTCSEPETHLVAEESTYFFDGSVSRTARKNSP